MPIAYYLNREANNKTYEKNSYYHFPNPKLMYHRLSEITRMVTIGDRIEVFEYKYKSLIFNHYLKNVKYLGELNYGEYQNLFSKNFLIAKNVITEPIPKSELNNGQLIAYIHRGYPEELKYIHRLTKDKEVIFELIKKDPETYAPRYLNNKHLLVQRAIVTYGDPSFHSFFANNGHRQVNYVLANLPTCDKSVLEFFRNSKSPVIRHAIIQHSDTEERQYYLERSNIKDLEVFVEKANRKEIHQLIKRIHYIKNNKSKFRGSLEHLQDKLIKRASEIDPRLVEEIFHDNINNIQERSLAFIETGITSIINQFLDTKNHRVKEHILAHGGYPYLEAFENEYVSEKFQTIKRGIQDYNERFNLKTYTKMFLTTEPLYNWLSTENLYQLYNNHPWASQWTLIRKVINDREQSGLT